MKEALSVEDTLKLALEALIKVGYVPDAVNPHPISIAIAAIKEALAQPKHSAPHGEPVAWMDIDEKGAASGLRYWSEPDNRHEVALYTTPPYVPTERQRTWVGLTDEDKTTLAKWFRAGDIDDFDMMEEIETKLKEKNT